MVSRAAQAKPAIRPSMKARLMLSGPSGAGKTRTALIIANQLGGSTVLIDTEHGSALTYADDFDFQHIDWQPPFNPRELADTIADLAHNYDTVIVDSLSHFWKGEGGTLDIANGDFRGWKEATPAQDDMVLSVLRGPAHMLLCVRSKMAYEAEQNGNRMQVRKVGLAPVQRDDLEYELNVSARMSMAHTLSIDKTRCPLLADREFKAGHAHEMAELYAAWLSGGEPTAPPDVVRNLTDRMNALDEERRKACKAEFLAKIGRPELLRESQIAAARELVDSYEPEAAMPGEGPGDASPSPPSASSPADAPTPAADPDDEVIDAEIVEDGEPMNAGQEKALSHLLRTKRGAVGPTRWSVLSELLGREVSSSADFIGFDEAGAVIEALQDEDAA